MKRIEQIPTPALWILADRTFSRVDKAMTSNGGLDFGWDWPTAYVLFTRLVKSYRRVRDELCRRFRSSGLSAEEFTARFCEPKL